MTRIDDYFVLTPRLTPTEARVLVMAWWNGEETESPRRYEVRGEIVGPLCEYASTLHARVPLLPDPPLSRCQPLRTRATILEPCFWEPSHPFCYEMHLELHDDEQLLDMRRVIAGIRHLNVDGNELLLNGQPFFLQGIRHSADSSIAELEAWHEVDCRAFLTQASSSLCERTDRWGPMVLHMLIPGKAGEAVDQVAKLRNHPSLLMWVLPPGLNGDPLQMFTEAIRKLDPSRLIGRLVVLDESTDSLDAVDVLLLPVGHAALESPLKKPFIVLAHAPDAAGCSADSFTERLAQLRSGIGSPPGLVGVML